MCVVCVVCVVCVMCLCVVLSVRVFVPAVDAHISTLSFAVYLAGVGVEGRGLLLSSLLSGVRVHLRVSV